MNIIKIYTLFLHRLRFVPAKKPALITVRWIKDELYKFCVKNASRLYFYLQNICLPILVTCGLDQIHLLVALAGL